MYGLQLKSSTDKYIHSENILCMILKIDLLNADVLEGIEKSQLVRILLIIGHT